MTTFIVACLLVTPFAALGAAILVHLNTQRARRDLEHAQEELARATVQARLRIREVIATEVQQARERIAAERQRVRDKIATEVQQARQQITAERERAERMQEILSERVQRTHTQLADLQPQLADLKQQAISFQERYTEYDHVTTQLCSNIEQALPVFVSVLERTSIAETEVIHQVYFLNDQLVKIRNGVAEARRLVEEGIGRPRRRNCTGQKWGDLWADDPQGHLSAQWRD